MLKFTWKHKGLRMAKTVSEKQHQTGRTILSIFQTYSVSTAIDIIANQYSDPQINGTWNREHGNRPTQMWLAHFWPRLQKQFCGGRIVLFY